MEARFKVPYYRREYNALRRLKQVGLSSRGLVPDVYGCIEQLDPQLWQPHLRAFVDYELRPSAVFMQYIPGMRSLDLDTFNKIRMQKFIDILKEIHGASVVHKDPYPQNLMVLPDDPDDPNRVVWIDFDRAVTYDGTPQTPKERKGFEIEWRTVNRIGEVLVCF